jgi:two-component system sensor kinase FixL
MGDTISDLFMHEGANRGYRHQMTIQSLASLTRWPAPGLHDKARSTVFIVCGYVALYVALDWVSFFQVLPGTGFTPWNPPPAASLVLVIIKGLPFAPLLLVAGVVSDIGVSGCPLGIAASLTMNAITAIGYTGVAVTLRRFAHADQGFPRVADILWLPLIAGVGTFVVATFSVCTLVMMSGLPPNLAYPSVWHSFIGDLTGIVGLLPAVLTIPQAWARWKEVSPAARAFDIGLFVLALVFALSMVFGVAKSKELQFFYLLLLPVVWIGVRHGLAWSAIAILIEQLALISTIAVLDYPSGDFLAYQILSLAMAAMGLILGAVVTERQRAELYLRQQQAELYRAARLTTAGALGAAVVHEISQPLATLATYTHVCRHLMAASHVDFELLGRTIAKVESEVRRAVGIVERLRDFLGRSEPRWCPIDLTDMTRTVVAALADMARLHGVIVRIKSQPLSPIAADRIQLEQVLVNLIRNAIEAVGECGEREKSVWISIRHVDREIELAVEDNGRGVPAELADRLFMPFETSKQGGMGLGLSLSREIVKAHGGQLWRDATVTAGARFVLRLPCDGTGRP